ncbi:hypothetical protein BGZ63DRAFT_371831, partial [Mariannaea sp. PMI_226]
MLMIMHLFVFSTLIPLSHCPGIVGKKDRGPLDGVAPKERGNKKKRGVERHVLYRLVHMSLQHSLVILAMFRVTSWVFVGADVSDGDFSGSNSFLFLLLVVIL